MFVREKTTLTRDVLSRLGTVRTLLYCTVLYCTVLYCCTVLYWTVLYWTVLYWTVLYWTVLYCTVLYCSVLLLYCTVLTSEEAALHAPVWHVLVHQQQPLALRGIAQEVHQVLVPQLPRKDTSA